MPKKSKSEAAAATPSAVAPDAASTHFRRVRRDDVMEPPQPLRVGMDEGKLRELAESMREYGLIQPIAVTASGKKWEIVDGHRRYTAAGMLGWEWLEVMVFPDLASAKFGMMLHANIMREDVTAAEEGTQFVQLANEHGWSIDQLCKFFGRSEAYINARAQLVSDFPDIAPHVFSRELIWTQAEKLMKVKDPGRRAYLLDQAIQNGANARQLGVMIDDFKRQDRFAANGSAPPQLETAQVYAEYVQPRCVFCGRDDDPVNITSIAVHSYHRRDLELLMERIAGVPFASGQQT